MFKKVLVANRGVVAARVARTLNKEGIPWVAVYSEADADMAYVKEAHESFCIGPPPARQSYLETDTLLDVMQKSGCDAVHPGYGFLSENAAFAQSVEASGACFIGPRSADISEMGDKVIARRKMEAAGIPVLPATEPLDQGADLSDHIKKIGFPMLVKATAGGGGIGMQRVENADTLEAFVEKTRKLSERAFGDGTVYLERLLDISRHVEFQMIGDGMGNVRPLFERDCSIQRRHQKIIEEAPAPKIDRVKCDALAEHLASVLGAWNYKSLGTVEMLMDQGSNFYFLEMNTRLQVEHGVTEAVTELDLVSMQLQVAAGKTLNEVYPHEATRSGHAIELRIYAEDPVRFFPSTGQLTKFQLPQSTNVRVDTHLTEGDVITPHYDPMLALVIVKGENRREAISNALAALSEFTVEGPKTNIPFLRHVLASEEFSECRHHTTIAETMSKTAA